MAAHRVLLSVLSGFPLLSLLCLIAALLFDWRAAVAAAPVGSVRYFQKISDTSGGFMGALHNSSQFGCSVSVLGDVDGDNVNDLAVGALGDADGGTNFGAVYIVFLNANGSVKAEQKISSLAGNFSGVLKRSDYFGNAVSVLGDLDGDSVTELAVGAFRDDDNGPDTGAVWILFLNTDGTVKAQQKISALAGNFSGVLASYDNFGTSLSVLGDLDGDLVTDLAVTTPPSGAIHGAVWILSLNRDGTVRNWRKISLSGDGFGTSVSALGDVNGDGIADLAVGAAWDNFYRGAVWILFLNADGTVRGQQKINSTVGNFTGDLSSYDYFGTSLSALGDLDGDSLTDLAVGATRDDDGAPGGGYDRGAVWVLFLNADGTVKAQQKISSTAGNFSGPLRGGDYFGSAVAALGDLNGDSVTELAVGSRYDEDGGTDRGAVWILFLHGVPSESSATTGVPLQTTAFGPPANTNSLSTAALVSASTSVSSSMSTTASLSTSTSVSSSMSTTASLSTSTSVVPTPTSQGTAVPTAVTGGASENDRSFFVLVFAIVGAIVLIACVVVVAVVLVRRRTHRPEQVGDGNFDLGLIKAEHEHAYSKTPAGGSAYAKTPVGGETHAYAKTPIGTDGTALDKGALQNYAGLGSAFASSRDSAVMEESYGMVPLAVIKMGQTYAAAGLQQQQGSVIAVQDLRWGRELGRGAYGVVFDALYHDKRVAAKVITQFSAAALVEFEQEASTMRSIPPHRNVVQLIGVCHEPYALVQEFVDSGSLDVWLPKHWEELSEKQVLRIVQGIAQGMGHLHAHNVIHRDLAARNVLLGKDCCAKVADFGLARQNTDDNKTKSGTGPLKWMAPESIRDKEYSFKSDVFAFGITLVEIYTRSLPYPGTEAVKVALGVASGTLTHPLPRNAPAGVQTMISQCLAFKLQDRPSFEDIGVAVATMV